MLRVLYRRKWLVFRAGVNRVVRGDGKTEEVAHIGQVDMQPGDVFEIHTPGGGGFGQEP